MLRPPAQPTKQATAHPTSLPRAAWDFDHGGCPKDELEHCCFYEYALELPEVRDFVVWWRGNRKRVKQTGDEADNLLRDKWFGSSFRVLVDHPEFPEKHWLEIDPTLRRQRISQLGPRSTIHFPNNPPKYAGPEPANFTRLQAERLRWQAIKRETEALRNQFHQALAKNSLRRWPSQLRYYLSTEEVVNWKRQLSKLSAGKLDDAARKLLAECKRRIQRRHRSPFELVVYEIDWTLRPEELAERFRQWADANRAHPPRKRTGGHPTKAVQLLKALGAKRLLDFFRQTEQRKVIPHAAALTSRTAEGRPRPPLYNPAGGWKKAEALAKRHLKQLSA